MSDQTATVKYPAICQSCVFATNPVMLSGYCIKSECCDRCKRTGDLALVKVTVTE